MVSPLKQNELAPPPTLCSVQAMEGRDVLETPSQSHPETVCPAPWAPLSPVRVTRGLAPTPAKRSLSLSPRELWSPSSYGCTSWLLYLLASCLCTTRM